jgi:hypothetical protein
MADDCRVIDSTPATGDVASDGSAKAIDRIKAKAATPLNA